MRKNIYDNSYNYSIKKDRYNKYNKKGGVRPLPRPPVRRTIKRPQIPKNQYKVKKSLTGRETYRKKDGQKIKRYENISSRVRGKGTTIEFQDARAQTYAKKSATRFNSGKDKITGSNERIKQTSEQIRDLEGRKLKKAEKKDLKSLKKNLSAQKKTLKRGYNDIKKSIKLNKGEQTAQSKKYKKLEKKSKFSNKEKHIGVVSEYLNRNNGKISKSMFISLTPKQRILARRMAKLEPWERTKLSDNYIKIGDIKKKIRGEKDPTMRKELEKQLIDVKIESKALMKKGKSLREKSGKRMMSRRKSIERAKNQSDKYEKLAKLTGDGNKKNKPQRTNLTKQLDATEEQRIQSMRERVRKENELKKLNEKQNNANS